MYRKEHPKPQFMRKNWMNLNGTWQFEFDYSDSGKEKEFYRNDKVYNMKIEEKITEEVRAGVTEYCAKRLDEALRISLELHT